MIKWTIVSLKCSRAALGNETNVETTLLTSHPSDIQPSVVMRTVNL